MNICTHNYTATDVLLGGFITISYTIRPLSVSIGLWSKSICRRSIANYTCS